MNAYRSPASLGASAEDLIFNPESPRLKLIAGDASDRKFYRFQSADRTLICMLFPSWEGGYGGDPFSWLGMHEALEKWGIPVPAVLKVDPENCCIWTTDLGDEFIHAHLGSQVMDSKDPERHRMISLYKESLELVVKAQYPSTEESQNVSHPAIHRFFDVEKLNFELHFFGTHFLGGLLNESSSLFAREWNKLSERIASRPMVLCHRDYHARNLLVFQGKVFWIDFQDARMGPHTYDVASLLRDSYVKMSRNTRVELFAHYVDVLSIRRRECGLEDMSRDELEEEFALVGLQRNIKALGSFAYLYRQKAKKIYLSYINHTLDNLLYESARHKLAQDFPLTFSLLRRLRVGTFQPKLSELLRSEKIDHF